MNTQIKRDMMKKDRIASQNTQNIFYSLSKLKESTPASVGL